MSFNPLLPQAQSPTPQSSTPMPQNQLLGAGPLAAQPSVPPIPSPKVSPERLKRSIKTAEVTIKGLSKIVNDSELLNNSNKLQKALLAQAADVYKASGGDNSPDELISHALDIMKDPKGPQSAIKDRIAMVLGNMGDVDMYARNNHGFSAIEPSNPTPAGDVNG